MAFHITDQIAGNQAIADTSTTQKHPFGTIVRATDPTLGEGEFIYLKGVASTAVGSWVTYNPDDWTTTLVTGNAIGPVAVAMSINDAATDFGWYQIHGKASALAEVVSDNARVYIDASTAGNCDDADVAGDLVHNAKWAAASTAVGTLTEVEIARPHVNDAVL